MPFFLRTAAAASLALALSAAVPLVTGQAHAAEPIVGTWKLADGRTIRFSGSGSRFCGTAVGGKFSGRSIGCVSGRGSAYRGKIKDLTANKTYTGKVSVKGNAMKLSGCVLGGLICRGVNARRR